MELDFARVLVVYGPLGVIALLSIGFAIFKDKALTTERASYADQLKAHALKIEEIGNTHKEELKALEERYISKAESWMQQYHENAAAQTAVLESLQKRRRDP